MIPFNKPYLSGKELLHIQKVFDSGHLSGNGKYSKLCHSFFEEKYGIKKALLTTSCTDALEICAMLINIKPGDEVIIPSYTFVSTALAFVRQDAKIVFADSGRNHPNIDVDLLEKLITEKTKAIIPVHYAGVSVDMEKIMYLAQKYNLYVIEDAAQAIDSYYQKKPLGSIGDLGVLSFHETKNIISGEGGLLMINNEKFIKRAEILWEKGTNRSSFFRGEVNKYGWVDIGSSFLPSEILAAFLYAQLENLNQIQTKRISIWQYYYNNLTELSESGYFKLPVIDDFATNNGHMFYILCRSENERADLIEYLKKRSIYSVFHYLSLHKSEFYKESHDGRNLVMSDYYTDHLLRLPMFYELTENDLNEVINGITSFFKSL